MKSLSKFLLYLLSGLLVLVLAVVLSFQFETSRQWYLGLANKALLKQQQRLELVGIRGFVPFHWQVAEINLADSQGVWLQIHNLELHWSALSLLKKSLHIDVLKAQKLNLTRLPDTPADKRADPVDEAGSQMAFPPGLPFAMRIDQFSIEQLRLGKNISPATADLTFRLQQQLLIDNQQAEISFQINSFPRALQTRNGLLQLQLGWDSQQQLALNLQLELDSQLLRQLQQQLGVGQPLPQYGDLVLNLDGKAPWRQWRGQLQLSWKQLAQLQSQLALNWQAEQLKLQAAHQLQLDEPFLAYLQLPKAAAALKMEQQLQLQDDKLYIQKNQFEHFFGNGTVTGMLDLSLQKMQLNSQLQIPELNRLASWIPDLKGNLSLQADIGGQFNTPNMQYRLQARRLRYQQMDIGLLEQQGQIFYSPEKSTIRLKGQLQQLDLSQWLAIPQQKLDWHLDLQLHQQQLQIKQLELDGDLLQMAVHGRMDLQNLQGQFYLQQQLKDIGLFISVPDEPPTISGHHYLQATIETEKQLKAVHLDLSGRLQQLSVLPEALQALMGEQPSWSGKITVFPLAQQPVVALKTLQVDAQAMHLDAHGQVPLDNSGNNDKHNSKAEIALSLQSHIDDLSVLELALQKQLQGSLRQQLSVSGTLDKPALALELEGENLVLNHHRLGKLLLHATFEDILQQPSGQISLRLDQEQKQNDKQVLRLDSSFRTRDEELQISRISFVAPASEIQGQLSYDWRQHRLSGKLDGSIEDLQALDFLHQQNELRGNLDIHVDLGETISYQLSSQQLSHPLFQIQQGKLWGWLKDWQGNPNFEQQLQITKLQLGNSGKTNHNTGRFSFKTSGFVKPSRQQPLLAQLDSQIQWLAENQKDRAVLDASLQLEGEQLQLDIEQLFADWTSQQLELSRPWQLKLLETGQKWQLQWQNMQLRYTSSQAQQQPLQSTLTLEPGWLNPVANTANIKFKLQQLPLGSLAQLPIADAALFEAMNGKIDASLNLSGTIDQPQLEFDAYLQQFAMDRVRAAKIRQVDVQLNLGYAKEQAEIAMELFHQKQSLATVKGQLPVRLSLMPFELDSQQHNKTLDLKIYSSLPLQKLQQMYPLERQQFAGQLLADIAIRGSLHKPQFNGKVQLRQGHYENADTGTVLKNIRALIKLENQKITLQHLNAEDFMQGHIQGIGDLVYHADKLNYHLRLRLDQARLLNHDEMQMQVSGDVALQGNEQSAHLQTRLNIDKGAFILPDSQAVALAELPVTEINHPHRDKKSQPIAKQAQAYPLELDVQIKLPSRMYIRGRGLESEWSGDLKVSGTSEKPVLAGQLAVKRGHFNFISHRFNFDKGVVNFVGSLPPQPQLDFSLSANARDMKAILKISGTAQRPEIKLSSLPKLPDDEILSRLLFDKSINEINGFEAVQLASAVKTLATGGSGFMDKTRDTLGFDTLDLNGLDGEGGGSVKMGKHLSEDVYMEVETSMSSGSQVKVEMEMTDQISVESRVDQESNTGFGINWKFDY